MSWYRRYRPRTISGLHLSRVRETFESMMAKGKLPQVLLFAGPKGTGKTSTARIVAAMVNDPRNQEVIASLFLGGPQPSKALLYEPNPDHELLNGIFDGTSWLVQELDAASNRGIDDIRLIKERIHLPPQAGLMTVYIFDEVHMLTTEAFNALLKLLEEPPAHVLFILATTELHKIPSTIISRAMMVEFTQATTTEISQALTAVLKQENISFEPGVLELIATSADGSFRDAVKLAELLSSTLDSLTVASVSQALQTNISAQVKALLEAVVHKQPEKVVSIFAEFRTKGTNPDQVTSSLFSILHQTVLQHVGVAEGSPFISQQAALFIIQELQQLLPNTSPIPLLNVEIKLLDLIYRSQQKNHKTEPPAPTGKTTDSTIKKTEKQTKFESPSSQTSHVEQPITHVPEFRTVALSQSASPPEVIQSNASLVVSDNLLSVSPGDSQKLLAQWEAFVDLVRTKNSSLAALLKSAEPVSAENGSATIAVYYKFHKEQLQQPKFMKMIEECAEPLIGGRIKLEFVLREPTLTSSPTQTDAATGSQTLSSLAEELLV